MDQHINPFSFFFLFLLAAENKVLAPKYESACLSDHKYANKEFFTQLSFPSLQVLSLENTKIKDEVLTTKTKKNKEKYSEMKLVI